MLILYETYSFLLIFLLILSQFWYFFIKNFFIILKTKIFLNTKFNKLSSVKFLNYKLILNFFFFINFFFFKGIENTLFWNHFYISNQILYLILFLLIFNFFFYKLIFLFSKTQIIVNYEYLFSIFNLMILFPLIFFSNTICTFFFTIEIISCLIFYKFVVSKFWLLNVNTFSQKIINSKLNFMLPKYHVNTLFFQYWSSFFSSTLILVSLINIYFFFGTTDFFFFNFFLKWNNLNYYFFNKQLLFLIFPLSLGILIKLGITPIHLYKLEIYNGLPFLSIFLYSTYFLIIYFLFFYLLFVFILTLSNLILWFFINFIIVIGLFYLINFFFDIFLIKSFFALSTIINLTNFILVLLLN